MSKCWPVIHSERERGLSAEVAPKGGIRCTAIEPQGSTQLSTIVSLNSDEFLCNLPLERTPWDRCFVMALIF